MRNLFTACATPTETPGPISLPNCVLRLNILGNLTSLFTANTNELTISLQDSAMCSFCSANYNFQTLLRLQWTLLPGWSLVSASLTNDKSLGLLCTLGKRTVGWELSNSDRFGAFFAHQVCGIKLKIKLISMIRVRIASGRISSSLGKKRLWTAS